MGKRELVLDRSQQGTDVQNIAQDKIFEANAPASEGATVSSSRIQELTMSSRCFTGQPIRSRDARKVSQVVWHVSCIFVMQYLQLIICKFTLCLHERISTFGSRLYHLQD